MSPSGMPSADLLGEQIHAILADSATTHGLARTLRAAAKEIELHRYHYASRRAWPNGWINDKPAKVQIGGGAHRIDGFFNIDLVPPADLLWDIREGIPSRTAARPRSSPSTSWNTSTTRARPSTTSGRPAACSCRAVGSSPAFLTPPSL